MRKLSQIFVFISVVLNLCPLRAAAKTKEEVWKVATLEAPPLMCSHCPEQGAGAKILREVLGQLGVEVRFQFLPGARGLKEGKKKNYAGAYPLWIEEAEQNPEYEKSVALFESPVVLIFPAGKRIKWTKLSDFKGSRIGVLKGYGKTKSLIELVQSNRVKVDYSLNELSLIKKVAAGRVDVALIDLTVLQYYLVHDLADLEDRIDIDDKIVETKTLHLALNRKKASELKKINMVIQNIDTQQVFRNYLVRNYSSGIYQH